MSTGRVAARSGSRGLLSNSVSQLLAFVARAVAGLSVVVLLARTGGPQALGVFQFALTLTALLPYYWGLPSLLAREVARRPETARAWVEAGLLVALAAGGLLTLLVPAAAVAVGAPREMTSALALASLGMAFDGVARVQFAAFWAWERMDLEAVVTAAQESAYLLGAAAVVVAGGRPSAVLVVFAASRALGAVGSWLIVSRRLGARPLPRGAGMARRAVRQATPFMLNDTLTLTYMRVDSVLLGVLQGPRAVGLYQAGTNLVLYFNVLARSINRPLYPRMGRAWPDRLEEFRRLCGISFAALHLLAVPITVGSLLLAPRTFDLLYGPRFAEAVLAYQLLVLVIPIRMLGHTLSLSLSATDRQARRTAAVAAAAALNIGLNLWLIPRWSYVGAAVATVVCEGALLVAYAALQRSVTGGAAVLRGSALPVAASVPMGAAVLATGQEHLAVSVLLGAATYAAAVLGLALLRAPRGSWRRPSRAVVALVRPVP